MNTFSGPFYEAGFADGRRSLAPEVGIAKAAREYVKALREWRAFGNNPAGGLAADLKREKLRLLELAIDEVG